MMLSATDLAPRICLDCGAHLIKPKHGRLEERHISTTTWFVPCVCGAIYVWSWDETGFNGGIYKRRHTLPLFDDRMRIEITAEQVKAGERRRIFNEKVAQAAQERISARMRARKGENHV